MSSAAYASIKLFTGNYILLPPHDKAKDNLQVPHIPIWLILLQRGVLGIDYAKPLSDHMSIG
jgi:hypothetical protein